MDGQGYALARMLMGIFALMVCVGGVMVALGNVALSELSVFYQSLGIAASMCGIPTIITYLAVSRGKTSEGQIVEAETLKTTYLNGDSSAGNP